MQKKTIDSLAVIQSFGFSKKESNILNRLSAEELAYEIRKPRDNKSIAEHFRVLILKTGDIQLAKDEVVRGLRGIERSNMLTNLRMVCYRLRKAAQKECADSNVEEIQRIEEMVKGMKNEEFSRMFRAMMFIHPSWFNHELNSNH